MSTRFNPTTRRAGGGPAWYGEREPDGAKYLNDERLLGQ